MQRLKLWSAALLVALCLFLAAPQAVRAQDDAPKSSSPEDSQEWLSVPLPPGAQPRITQEWLVGSVTSEDQPHLGTDLATSCGTNVLALADGTVMQMNRAAWDYDPAGWGKALWIDVNLSQGGVGYHYAHLQDILVQPGQRVERGQVVATVGSSGFSIGCHLHIGVFNINPNDMQVWYQRGDSGSGGWVDPNPYLGTVSPTATGPTVGQRLVGLWWVLPIIVVLLLVLAFPAPSLAVAKGGLGAAAHIGKGTVVVGVKTAGLAYRLAYWAGVILGPFGRAVFGDPDRPHPWRRAILSAIPLVFLLSGIALLSAVSQATGKTAQEIAVILVREQGEEFVCTRLPQRWQQSCVNLVTGSSQEPVITVHDMTFQEFQQEIAENWESNSRIPSAETLFERLSTEQLKAAGALPSGQLPFPWWNGNSVSFEMDPVLWAGILEAVSQIHAEEGWRCDPLLLAAIAHSESPTFSNVENSIGAGGYYQFMPGTFPGVADSDTTLADRFDPIEASKAACRYTQRTKSLHAQTSEAAFIQEFAVNRPVWNAHEEQARYAWRLWQWLGEGMEVR